MMVSHILLNFVAKFYISICPILSKGLALMFLDYVVVWLFIKFVVLWFFWFMCILNSVFCTQLQLQITYFRLP